MGAQGDAGKRWRAQRSAEKRRGAQEDAGVRRETQESAGERRHFVVHLCRDCCVIAFCRSRLQRMLCDCVVYLAGVTGRARDFLLSFTCAEVVVRLHLSFTFAEFVVRLHCVVHFCRGCCAIALFIWLV